MEIEQTPQTEVFKIPDFLKILGENGFVTFCTTEQRNRYEQITSIFLMELSRLLETRNGAGIFVEHKGLYYILSEYKHYSLNYEYDSPKLQKDDMIFYYDKYLFVFPFIGKITFINYVGHFLHSFKIDDYKYTFSPSLHYKYTFSPLIHIGMNTHLFRLDRVE